LPSKTAMTASMEKSNLKRISCSIALAKCEFRESDFKRPPVSREYVATLESRIASLESLLSKLKSADSDERNRILDDLEDQDHVPSFSSLPLVDEIALSEAMTNASFQEMTDGSMIYHGPTSIFQNEVSNSMYPISSSMNSKPSPFHENRENLINQTMRLCIGLFFHWQYPLFMFIDREAFIQEYEVNPVNGNYCSPPLIYAVAALGALMSKDPEIRARSSEFAGNAQSILTTDELGVSRPTSVQAFLCLAYYEIGKSNMSKGWLFTGIAFRMGQDIGLQRDPARWGPEHRPNPSNPSPFNNEFRRRIYWGSFLSDKMFSLYLGRPTFMYENDADVNISEPRPLDPPVWENWLCAHNLGFLKTTGPAGPKLTLLFNQQVELARIVHDMLSQTFAPKKMKDPTARRWNEVSLNKLNARLLAWHEALPTDMRWKNWITNKDVLQPNLAILHMFYHSTRICLNLPFVASVRHIPAAPEGITEASSNPIIKSFRICQSSAQGIVDVLQRFRHQHTLENTPLIFVGATIIATNTVLVTTRRQGNSLLSKKETLLPTLDVALEEMSVSWKLAAEARQKVKNAFNSMQQQHPGSPSETRESGLSPDSGVQTCDQPPVVDPAKIHVSANPTFINVEQESLGTVPQTSEFESPEQSVWEPMSVLDSEAAYWGNLGNDIFAGWSLDFVNEVTDFDWPDQSSVPK
ncbi:transcription factor, partial [Colletotrichum incanum]